MTKLPIVGEFTVTAVYGQTGSLWSTYHRGIDFVCSNKNIYCTCDGVVRVVTFDAGGWGNYVSVGDSSGRRHIFCHLDSVKVKVGDRVERGTVIGIMGKTGNATGVHLHYEVHDSSNADQDPSIYLGIPNKKGTYNSADYDLNFADSADIASWARPYVKKVTDAGIMVGDADGRFDPQGFLTREQAAVIVVKLLERM